MLLRGRSPISWLLMWRSLSSEPWTLGLTLSRSGDLVSASHEFKMWMSISVPVGMLHAMALLVNINTMSKPRPYQLPPDTALLVTCTDCFILDTQKFPPASLVTLVASLQPTAPDGAASQSEQATSIVWYSFRCCHTTRMTLGMRNAPSALSELVLCNCAHQCLAPLNVDRALNLRYTCCSMLRLHRSSQALPVLAGGSRSSAAPCR